MRFLVDTNVVLDLMLARQPFAVASAKVVGAVELRRYEGYLCATTITTIHYLAAKALGREAAAAHVADLLRIFRIAAVTDTVLSDALKRDGKDFEDDVLVEAARDIGADGIITRNAVDFAKAGLPVYQPEDIVVMLGL